MTSFVGSKVDSVGALRFLPIGVKPFKVTRAVRVDNVVVFLDDRGRIYSSEVSDRVSYSIGFKGLQKTFAACVKLGVLTAAAVREHKDHTTLEAARRDRSYAAQSLGNAARELGLKLTKAQRRRAVGAIEEAALRPAIAAARMAEAGLL